MGTKVEVKTIPLHGLFLESFNKVRGLCPKCKKSVIIDGWVCPCCGYDSSGEEELYKYGD